MAWYEITVEGFTCHAETWDTILQTDGKRDEVFIYTIVRLVDKSGTILVQSEKQSVVMGDINGLPGRVVAGSASPLGGIRTGDVFPYNPPWVRQGSLQSDHPPMLVWEGQLTDDRAVAIIPSIWEWDGGSDMFNDFLKNVANNGPNIGAAVAGLITAFGGARLPADAIKTSAETGLPALERLIGNFIGIAADRPIGMVEDGPDKYVFNPTALVMNNPMAELIVANNFGFGPGIIGIDYRDDPRLAGNYSLYVKITKVADDLVYNDGLLWRESSSAPVWITFGQAKFFIPSPDWLFRFGQWADVRVVPDGSMTAVPEIPRDGTVLREWSSAPVYVVLNGQKCWITDPAKLEQKYGGWPAVKVVPDGGLNQIPTGPDAP